MKGSVSDSQWVESYIHPHTSILKADQPRSHIKKGIASSFARLIMYAQFSSRAWMRARVIPVTQPFLHMCNHNIFCYWAWQWSDISTLPAQHCLTPEHSSSEWVVKEAPGTFPVHCWGMSAHVLLHCSICEREREREWKNSLCVCVATEKRWESIVKERERDLTS